MALSAGDKANGWWYRCQLPLTIALAMRGLTGEAAAALAALEDRRHPSWRCLDYEYAIARAWVAAAQGAVSAGGRDAVVGGRNRPGQWAVRGGGDVFADRHPVR